GSYGGNIWIHPDAPNGAAPLMAKYTNLAGNARTFCGGYYSYILDIAYDGNDYAWVIDGSGYLFISTLKQDALMGGPMKLIVRISNHPGDYSWGIAFDTFGYVYYGGASAPAGWVHRAHTSTLLDTTSYFKDPDRNYGDMASCAYPKVEISHLLA
ncbi:hypothetical protein CPC16_000945, partial [Podila verticillata]